MPSIITLGSMSASALGISQQTPFFWLNYAGTDIKREEIFDVTTDSFSNLIVVGQSGSSGSPYGYIAKFSSSGKVQWQKSISVFSVLYNVVTDASNNIYAIGYYSNTSAQSYIVKYDSTGTVVWQKSLYSSVNSSFSAVTIDSSANIVVAGYTVDSPSDNQMLVASFTSSGSVNWQKKLSSTNTERFNAIAVDSSNNVYVGGASNGDAFIAKYNNSGVLQWQNVIGTGVGGSINSAICDTSGNVYFAGLVSSGYLVKVNSSGTIQWQKSLPNNYSHVNIDSLDNIYITGASSSTSALVAKYNNSGVLQWQRTLSGSASTIFNSITFDKNNNLCIAGRSTQTGQAIYRNTTMRVPNDGSRTGTYGGLVYASSSLTETTPSYTASSTTLTDATAGLTLQTVSGVSSSDYILTNTLTSL